MKTFLKKGMTKDTKRKELLAQARNRMQEIKERKKEINEIDFCSCLLGYFKLNNCFEFDPMFLANFLSEKFQNDENLRLQFSNLNFSRILEEGLYPLESCGMVKRNIFSSNPRIKICIDRKEAFGLTRCIKMEDRILIEILALDFLFPNRKNLDPQYILRKGV